MKMNGLVIIGIIVVAIGSLLIILGQQADSSKDKKEQESILESHKDEIIGNSEKNTEKLLKSDEATRQEIRQPTVSVLDIFVDNQDNL